MDDPELRGDEQILVRTQGIHVKSISFEGILTNKRIILIDRLKNLLPPKEIPLATVRAVEGGENPIREQTITLSVIGKTGDTRQMILTLTRVGGGNRTPERDEWVRYIHDIITSPSEPVFPAPSPGETARAPVSSHEPVPQATRYTEQVTQPSAPAAPELVLGTFCTKCGNRVPESSEFCNRCGTRIISVPDVAPAPVVQEPAPGAGMKKERPIDRDIQTIEPLIEKSSVKVPRDSLRTTSAEPARKVPSVDTPPATTPAPAENHPPAAAPVGKPSKPSRRQFIPRLFSPKELPPTPLVPGSMPTAPPSAPAVPRKPRRSKMAYMVIAIVLILIIAAVAVMVVLPKLGSGTTTVPSSAGSDVSGTVTASTTTSTSSGGVVVAATQTPVAIPATGIVIYANYIGGWKGMYGPTDDLQKVTNSGERIYTLENANGTIEASFWKLDGSSHEISVAIYKDGKQLTNGITSARYGKVTLSVDPATGIAQTPVISGDTGITATSAVAGNTTAAPTVTPVTTLK